MVKKTVKQKKKGNKTPTNGGANKATVARVKRQLDEGARQWLRLLSDPCSAPLVQPCYENSGTGLLFRAHQVFQPNAEAVDFVYEFTPSYGGAYCNRYGWSSTTGGSLGNAGTFLVGGLFGSGTNVSPVGRARCVAACVKVVYTGKEVDRRGVVAGTLDAGASYSPGEFIGWTALASATNMPFLTRLGADNHEYRWFPGQNDAEFVAYSEEEVTALDMMGNSLQLTIVNATPGAFYIDVVSVWEWQPKQEESVGMVALMSRPPSNVTFNAITRSIGDLGSWALGQAAKYGPALMSNLAIPGPRLGSQFAALTM